MTIEYRPPRPDEEGQLRALFTEAFHDAWFTELFFEKGYSPDRCLLAAQEEVLAALHWFDCTAFGKRTAYVYGIAAFEHCRGRGIGSALIRAALAHLDRLGYGQVLLVPAEEGLFGYYARFGFSAVSSIHEETIPAGAPLPLRRLSRDEYAALRRAYLPENGVLQEGAALALLEGYADFFATEKALCAVSGRLVWELLGDSRDGAGLLGALGIPEAIVRTPGVGKPFAMGIGFDRPVHFGLALD